MGNFSKLPQEVLLTNLGKGYIGLHIEQGVPVLDRDLNLINDLISATVRSILSRFIGDGVADDRSFAIQAIPADNDFWIRAGNVGGGKCLVSGIEFTIEHDIRYGEQSEIPQLTTPTQTREDKVYLDVWLAEIDGGKDPDLLNNDDIGMQTSVRLQTNWQVRVAEGGDPPSPEKGHAYYLLAQIKRPAGGANITNEIIQDLRQTRLNLMAIERRLSFLEQPSFDSPPRQFQPQKGQAGTGITLFGKNFNLGTPRVLFGDVKADIIGTPTATKIVVTVPANIPSHTPAISVITARGTAVSDDQFTVEGPPAFAQPGKQFTPQRAGADMQVTLCGSNFDGSGLGVSFGNHPADVTKITATMITVTVPERVAEEHVKITVTTQLGCVTSDDDFSFIGAPAFAEKGPQFSPKKALYGDCITLYGKNFDGKDLKVYFPDPNSPGDIVSSNATTIVVKPPKFGGPGSSIVKVETAYGTVESTEQYEQPSPK